MTLFRERGVGAWFTAYRYGARELWRQNGGMPTYRELLYHRTPHERNTILRFLAGLPDHLNIVVGFRKFHLVHGFPGEGRDTHIWGRVDADRSPYRDTTGIVGHTPTSFLTGRDDEDFRIWHGAGIIDIDRGCGSRKAVHCRLACLRLDDMAECYVGGTGREKIVPPRAPHDSSGGTAGDGYLLMTENGPNAGTV